MVRIPVVPPDKTPSGKPVTKEDLRREYKENPGDFQKKYDVPKDPGKPLPPSQRPKS
jgi:hypothetical protein